MLFFLRAWGLRSATSNLVDSEVDDLVLLFGDNAYAEAGRQRIQANDPSTVGHWSAIQSEIRRRIMQVCAAAPADTADLFAFDAPDDPIRDPAVGTRTESWRIAEGLEIVGKTVIGRARRPEGKGSAVPTV
jgi:hypothetical protein